MLTEEEYDCSVNGGRGGLGATEMLLLCTMGTLMHSRRKQL